MLNLLFVVRHARNKTISCRCRLTRFPAPMHTAPLFITKLVLTATHRLLTVVFYFFILFFVTFVKSWFFFCFFFGWLIMIGMYLCDSGGQYLDGTTDITRTVHLGRSPLKSNVFIEMIVENIRKTEWSWTSLLHKSITSNDLFQLYWMKKYIFFYFWKNDFNKRDMLILVWQHFQKAFQEVFNVNNTDNINNKIIFLCKIKTN